MAKESRHQYGLLSQPTDSIYNHEYILCLLDGSKYAVTFKSSFVLLVQWLDRRRLSILPGLFQFLSPGTFRVSRSCPARTTGPSRSLGPVLPGPRDLGPFVPGVLPGPRDQTFFCMLLHFFRPFLSLHNNTKKK